MAGHFVKLNIGSSTSIRGQYGTKEWVNIDIVHPGTSISSQNYVLSSALNLSFKDNSFNEVRAIHCLEHIPRKQHELFYKEVYRVLQPNGIVFIEVPNFIEICKLIVKATESKNPEVLRIWTTSVYGKNRHAGDKHYWGFSKDLLKTDLEKNGFKVEFPTEMISEHHKQEPVLLARGIKV